MNGQHSLTRGACVVCVRVECEEYESGCTSLRLLTYLLIYLLTAVWTGVTSSPQARLRMFPCPGSTSTTTCRVFPDHLITYETL